MYILHFNFLNILQDLLLIVLILLFMCHNVNVFIEYLLQLSSLRKIIQINNDWMFLGRSCAVEIPWFQLQDLCP